MPTTVAPRYETLDQLGEGGMGVVLRASDRDLNRDVAIKVMRPEIRESPAVLEGFVREGRVIARLEHPGIPPVHDAGEDSDGCPYLVMRLVRGVTLKDVIEALARGDEAAIRRYSFAVRARLMQQLCEAVQFAFEQGVVHRDLKPENVMVGPFGELQLMDWGLAFDLNSGEKPADGFAGTPAYAAPERFESAESALTLTSEVWSLGAVMYELFCLRPPFEGATLAKVIQSVMSAPIQPPDRSRGPGQTPCPREYSGVILRALERDPAARFGTATAMRDAIQSALDDEAPVVCPVTGFKRGAGWLDHLVDDGGGLVAFVLGLWALLPLFLLAWLALVR